MHSFTAYSKQKNAYALAMAMCNNTYSCTYIYYATQAAQHIRNEKLHSKSSRFFFLSFLFSGNFRKFFSEFIKRIILIMCTKWMKEIFRDFNGFIMMHRDVINFRAIAEYNKLTAVS